ncbi:type I-E CRISPR-associated protein Cas6/Cse3/CasE [Nocardia tengchongensis]|uniref:type I-E CRISPR-associated protein Cas6/Cse3/CasE n=1 Tax=Nocardia tengchongensis TaxID=2055889 RepID=UPI0036B41821
MTLWLTRITVDPRDRQVRGDLTNAVRMHQRIMTLMPDGLGANARQQAGVLYRIDETRSGTQLLIQSSSAPQLEALPDSYGTAEIRDLSPLLDALHDGLSVRYRLAANASKRLGRTSGHEGKVVALRGQAADEWWLDRAQRCGLGIKTLTGTSQADQSGHRRDAAAAERVRHAVVRFDGLAVITDTGALQQALCAGVGRGKSHGCGLLSLAIAR